MIDMTKVFNLCLFISSLICNILTFLPHFCYVLFYNILHINTLKKREKRKLQIINKKDHSQPLESVVKVSNMLTKFVKLNMVLELGLLLTPTASTMSLMSK